MGDIQRIKQIHHQFVDLMYQDFGWNQKPKYAEIGLIEMQDGLSAHSLTGNHNIWVNQNLDNLAQLLHVRMNLPIFFTRCPIGGR